VNLVRGSINSAYYSTAIHSKVVGLKDAVVQTDFSQWQWDDFWYAKPA
jgi:hypothetical protein